MSELDYHTINYGLAWDWAITPRVHGVVSADRKEYRETFLDTTTGVNRTGLRTERVELAEGIYELGAAWRVLAGIAHTRSESSAARQLGRQPGRCKASTWGSAMNCGSGTSLTGRLRTRQRRIHGHDGRRRNG